MLFLKQIPSFFSSRNPQFSTKLPDEECVKVEFIERVVQILLKHLQRGERILLQLVPDVVEDILVFEHSNDHKLLHDALLFEFVFLYEDVIDHREEVFKSSHYPAFKGVLKFPFALDQGVCEEEGLADDSVSFDHVLLPTYLVGDLSFQRQELPIFLI